MQWGSSRWGWRSRGIFAETGDPRELSEMTKRSQDGPYRFPSTPSVPTRFTGSFITKPTLANVTLSLFQMTLLPFNGIKKQYIYK